MPFATELARPRGLPRTWLPSPAMQWCRYSIPGIPIPTTERQDSCSYLQLRAKELSSRTPAVRAPPHQTNGPDPPPARGRVRCRHVSPEEGCSAPAAGGTDLPWWLRDLHVSPGPPKRTRQHSAQEGSGAATCPTTASAGAGASLPPEDSPTHRI